MIALRMIKHKNVSKHVYCMMRSKRRNYAVSLKNSICTIWLWDPNVIIYTAKSFNLVFLSITITQILFAIIFKLLKKKC